MVGGRCLRPSNADVIVRLECATAAPHCRIPRVKVIQYDTCCLCYIEAVVAALDEIEFLARLCDAGLDWGWCTGAVAWGCGGWGNGSSSRQ